MYTDIHKMAKSMFKERGDLLKGVLKKEKSAKNKVTDKTTMKEKYHIDFKMMCIDRNGDTCARMKVQLDLKDTKAEFGETKKMGGGGA